MAGVFRFDAYVRDWFTGTRSLDLECRAVYWDLCCLIYEKGGPIKCELGGETEDDLRKAIGIGKVSKLRRILGRLVGKAKIWMVDGYIGNDRAIQELWRRSDFQASCNNKPWGDLSEAIQFEIIRALSRDNRRKIERLSPDNRPMETPISAKNKALENRPAALQDKSSSMSKESSSSESDVARATPLHGRAPGPRAKPHRYTEPQLALMRMVPGMKERTG